MTAAEQPFQDAPARRRPPFWVVTLYFAEGFPYSIVRQISTVFFKDFGASLQAVGMTSLYGLPWVLKFSWAPLVDAFSTKRRWLLAAEIALVAALVALAFGSALPTALYAGGALLAVIALFAATQDSAIDGYYLEALDKKRQAQYVGFQAMSYRLALVAGGGGIVWISGKTSWSVGFGVAAGAFAALLAIHTLFLPRIEIPQRPVRAALALALKPRSASITAAAVAAVALGVWSWRLAAVQSLIAPLRPALERIGAPGLITLALLVVLLALLVNLPRLKARLYASDSFYARAFVDYLDQPRAAVILAFLVTYRTGESCLLAMVYPLLKDIGITRAQYGVIYGTFGIAASIAGGIVGGLLIGRLGLRKVIWPLVLVQNIPHLLYMALALIYQRLIGHPELGAADPWLVSPFVVMEAFGAGMGTSVFMVFIMRTCKPDHKAAHMAIATSIMNVSSTLAGVLSGFLAAWIGFPAFFAFTFVVTLPSMALIFFLPQLDAAPAGVGAR